MSSSAVPAEQNVHDEAPAAANWPISHATHARTSVAYSASDSRPGGQASQISGLAATPLPASATIPSVWKKPAAQPVTRVDDASAHVSVAAAALWLIAGHSQHVALSVPTVDELAAAKAPTGNAHVKSSAGSGLPEQNARQHAVWSKPEMASEPAFSVEGAGQRNAAVPTVLPLQNTSQHALSL